MIGDPIPRPQGAGVRFSPAVVTAVFALVVAVLLVAYANGTFVDIKAEQAADPARDAREQSQPTAPAGARPLSPAPAPSGATDPAHPHG